MPVIRFPLSAAGRRGRPREETATKEHAQNEPPQRRKLIAFDGETWNALDLLARDSMKSIQELADEAFADLLKKHHRPTDVKQALRESARLTSGNEDRTDHPKRHRNRPTKKGRPRDNVP
jgi:hypothetical protein